MVESKIETEHVFMLFHVVRWVLNFISFSYYC